MRQKLAVALFLVIVLAAAAVAAPRQTLSTSGVVEGVIDITTADDSGVLTIWVLAGGKKYEFTIKGARIGGGYEPRNLVGGLPVRVQYQNLQPGVTRDFFTGQAVAITVLSKRGR